MLQLRRWLHPGSLAVGILAGVTAAFLISASVRPAVAETADTTSPAAVITYSAGYLNKVVATVAKDKIEEVIPFPTQPVFLARTTTNINVWERRGSSIVNILDFALDGDFKAVEFLDDNKTFIVHTKKSASVYTLDRIVTVPKEKKK